MASRIQIKKPMMATAPVNTPVSAIRRTCPAAAPQARRPADKTDDSRARPRRPRPPYGSWEFEDYREAE